MVSISIQIVRNTLNLITDWSSQSFCQLQKNLNHKSVFFLKALSTYFCVSYAVNDRQLGPNLGTKLGKEMVNKAILRLPFDSELLLTSNTFNSVPKTDLGCTIDDSVYTPSASSWTVISCNPNIYVK